MLIDRNNMRNVQYNFKFDKNTYSTTEIQKYGFDEMTHIGIKGNYLADFQITSGFLAQNCTVSTMICT